MPSGRAAESAGAFQPGATAAASGPWFFYMRITLGLEYDVSRFLGWQTQLGAETVQDALETALGAIAGFACVDRSALAAPTGACMRTAQVVHSDAPVERPETAWVQGRETRDVAGIRWRCALVETRRIDFHARLYWAHSRTFTRHILLINRPVRPGARRASCGLVSTRRFDFGDAMRAALHLVGEHDFSAFRSMAMPGKESGAQPARSRFEAA